MITVQDAASLKHGDILEHVHNKDSRGNPMRCRVNGKVKFWTTRPEDFRIPVKYGLYHCFYIEPPINNHEWIKAVL